MEVEVALGNDLEQRFAIKIDLVVLRVGLIVDVRVSESEWTSLYPFEMMSPLAYLPGTVLTP